MKHDSRMGSAMTKDRVKASLFNCCHQPGSDFSKNTQASFGKKCLENLTILSTSRNLFSVRVKSLGDNNRYEDVERLRREKK